MTQRGFAGVYLIVGLVFLLVGFYYFGKNSVKLPLFQSSPILTQSTPTLISDETTDWKIYNSTKNHFSFKYPSDLTYLSESVDNNSVYIASSEGKGEGKGSPFGLDLFKDYWLSASVGQVGENGIKSWRESLSKPGKASKVVVDGAEGYIRFISPKAASEPVLGYEVIIMREDSLYKLSLLVGSEKALQGKKEVFDKIITTFKFL
ncbi:MAG: hypothetical protein C4584_00945 [Armatimonadetes bacterium]|nr:MAG: hypothetical protein C4584_00945 [Armatimonadota bacterium]